jgi:hypothetical protein
MKRIKKKKWEIEKSIKNINEMMSNGLIKKSKENFSHRGQFALQATLQ